LSADVSPSDPDLAGPPVPPAPQTVSTALLAGLKAEGVSHLFGIPGGALVGMLDALKADPTITYHICRQETGAAYIADGYARASGGLGVVLVTSGPGATNALTGVVNADASGSPVLVITGEIASAFFGRGYLQEGVDSTLDIVNVYASSISFSEMITSPANAVEAFQSAMRRVWGVPRKAAHLSLPGDVALQPPVSTAAAPAPSTYRVTNGFVDVAGIQAAVAAIATAKRPLILIGDGCRPALSDPSTLGAFVKAVNALSAPVVTDPDAKGLFPETHALSLRNVGLAACEWVQYYLDDPTFGQYDALVVLGSPLGELATDVWADSLVPAGPFIQVDDDVDTIGRAFEITRGVVGEMTAAIGAFITAAATAKVDPAVAAARRAFVASIKASHSPFVDPTKRVSTSVPIKPQALARIVSEGLPPGSRIFVDAGNCVGWCLHEMVVAPPTKMHAALAMGPMGFGTAAVVGAKLADPTMPCLAVVGDGGFLMQVAEVSTAAQYGIGAIWVVLADHDLTMVSQGMAAVAKDPSYEDYYKIGWTDLAAVATGMGATAYSIQTTDELTAALGQALTGADAGVPQVIVATIDTTEVPPYNYSHPDIAPP
jgi:acetolactate synthase I/II/III large subunit